jgi:hypothetical protein
MSIPGLSLVGFLPEPAAMNYFKLVCVYPPDCDDAQHAERWATAVTQLGTQPHVPDPGKPEIRDFPDGFETHLNSVRSTIRFQQVHASPDCSFKWIELAPLLAYQFHVLSDPPDLPSFSTPPTADEIVNACLPLAGPQVPVGRVATGDANQGSVVYRSESLNFSVLGVLGGATGYEPQADLFPTGVAVGMRTPFVQVAQFDGRCYLRNGYHRAAQLLRAGATHLACIFQDVADYRLVDQRVGMGSTFDMPTMQSENPPSVAHFGDAVALHVPLRKFSRTIAVTWTDVTIPDV